MGVPNNGGGAEHTGTLVLVAPLHATLVAVLPTTGGPDSVSAWSQHGRLSSGTVSSVASSSEHQHGHRGSTSSHAGTSAGRRQH